MDAWENGGGGGADSYSSSTTTGGGSAEIFEEQAATGEEAATEEKVFVAVPEQHKSGKSLLAWTLHHVGAVAGTSVVVAHVHAPAQMIPMSTCATLLSRRIAPTSIFGSPWWNGSMELQMKCNNSAAAAGGGKVGGRRLTPASTFGIFMCRRRGFHLSAGFVLRFLFRFGSSNRVTVGLQRPRCCWDLYSIICFGSWLATGFPFSFLVI